MQQLYSNTQKWDQLYHHAKLITLNEKNGYGEIKNGGLAVRDGCITWIGSMDELPPPYEQYANDCYNLQGYLVTPGLIDCHTHLIYAGERSEEFKLRLQGQTYAEIAKNGGGILTTVQATHQATEQELLASAKNRLAIMQSFGVTTIEIKSGYGLDLTTEIKMLRVARQLGIECPIDVYVTYLGAHVPPGRRSMSADEYIDYICHRVLPILDEKKLADGVDAFCEPMAFTLSQIEKFFQTAKRYQLDCRVHAEHFSAQGAAKVAAKFKALSADHLEYLDEQGVKTMSKNNMVAVLLPGAWYYSQEKQKPPIACLREYEVPIALATDHNPGTSPCLSLPLIMNMGCVLFGLQPEEALRATTINAAKALGYSDRGRLAIGFVADLAVWDKNSADALACNMGSEPCVMTIYRGKPLGTWTK